MMSNPQSIFWIIVAFIVLEFVFNKVIDFLNSKSWDQKIPEIVEDLYDKEEYSKAKEYAKANGKLALISGIFSFVIILLFLFNEGFAFLDSLVRNWTDSYILQSLYFFGIISLVSMVMNLPFGIYKTFVIEEKFGFNKTTVKTFILDFIKGIVLGVIMGGLLLAVLVWLFHKGGDNFWFYIWLVVSGFSIFFAMFYTSLVVPIFNKLEPLEEGELRNHIESYAKKVDFSLKNIFVIDGSKRSSKSNAYFSGLGSKKAIVLYDTLIEDNSKEELTAILAHEVGHYKKKHIFYSIIISLIQTGIMFYIFGWLTKNENLALSLGAKENSFHIAMIAFGLLYAPISLISGILMNIFSRKNEFEADAFAKETYGAEPLMTSLRRLSVKHLSNLTPNRIYSFIHFSHPPLVDRLKALMR